ncbi:DUF1345 domain-containing protein [Erythrobacteraceae bacterium CFH 75059]|nr:DUF1345 domain-containing protein [Erythrobacteraceae bacterium CFH 75059]
MKHPRYLLFLVTCAVGSAALTLVLPTRLALLCGFSIAVLVFALSFIPLWRGGDPETLRREARRDDAGGLLLLALTVTISSTVLVALSLLLLERASLAALERILLLVALAAAWVFANLIFALHYARLFWNEGHGSGLEFPGTAVPDFADFVHFAAVIGMTCQTADIAITGKALRRVVTGHGLFAFVFNLGVLSLSVNLLAG